MIPLRIAVQKSGRLSEKSLDLLRRAGIQVNNGGKLKAVASNFPLEVLYLRDDDIPRYVAEGVADAGILGQNVVAETDLSVETIQTLGFARCRLSLAIRREAKYNGPTWFAGKRIASSYPNLLKRFLAENGVEASVEQISGSVEIAPSIGLADAVCDLVSTGSTLLANGLQEVEVIFRSEAVLIRRPELDAEQEATLDQLLFRLRAVLEARRSKYILLNAPNESLDEIAGLLPGMKSPTVLPLAESGWSSLHSVVAEDDFWNVIDRLKAAGAEGILVCPIEKLIA